MNKEFISIIFRTKGDLKCLNRRHNVYDVTGKEARYLRNVSIIFYCYTDMMHLDRCT